MTPRLHSTYPHRTHCQNCGVFPSRLPRPIRKLHKRRHHGRLRTRRGSLTPHSKPICNAGRQSILRHPNIIPHFLQSHCKSSNSSCSQGTANLTCNRFPTRLSHTFSEGAKSYSSCITTEGDHCTLSTYNLTTPHPNLCPPPQSDPHHVQGGRPQHQHLPSSNPTMTTQFCDHTITCGLVPVRLPTTVGKAAPKRVMSPLRMYD